MPQSDTDTFAYPPVPEIVSRLGLYVTGAGTDVVKAGAKYPQQHHPERYGFSWTLGRILPEYQLVFIADGYGDFESRETGSLPVQPGTVMILFPDVWHRYRPREDTGWTEYSISLGGCSPTSTLGTDSTISHPSFFLKWRSSVRWLSWTSTLANRPAMSSLENSLN